MCGIIQRYLYFFISVLGTQQAIAQSPYELSVRQEEQLIDLPLTLWGLSLSDVDFTIDGGLYAEQVKNRSFEFYNALEGWDMCSSSGNIVIINTGMKTTKNNRYVQVNASSTENVCLENDGFFGIAVKKNHSYRFSIDARKGNGNVELKIQLIGIRGDTLGEGSIKKISSVWETYAINLVSDSTDTKARLRVVFDGEGMMDIDMVSLFPDKTWESRKNGWRVDIMEKLKSLQPDFIRFPGACVAEGKTLMEAYPWKETLTDPRDRPVISNACGVDPQDYHSLGVGFFEYFLLAEDLGATPIPTINAGVSGSPQNNEMIALEQLDPYIQDALNLIEFAKGSATSTWGSKRSALGHASPFPLEYLAVGGVHTGEHNKERIYRMASAIKSRYPEIKLIASISQDETNVSQGNGIDITDVQLFENSGAMIALSSKFDSLFENSQSVMISGYHSFFQHQSNFLAMNNWGCALSEAIFMMAVEKKSDHIKMASYSSVLAHTETRIQKPNLLWFDNSNIVSTPSYYIQKMFAENQGTKLITVTHNDRMVNGQDGVYASGAWDEQSGDVIIKIVNLSTDVRKMIIHRPGLLPEKIKVTVQSIWSPSLTDFNSWEDQFHVSPITKQAKIKTDKFSITVNGNSFTVIRMPAGNRF